MELYASIIVPFFFDKVNVNFKFARKKSIMKLLISIRVAYIFKK